MQPVVERFKQIYSGLSVRSLGLLNGLYSDDVESQDPFHRLAGLPALHQYLAALYAQVEACSFRFERCPARQSVLTWTMQLNHPRLNAGAVVTVPGSTLIRFRDKVFYHRDYFDAGAMVYEQLPLIGMLAMATFLSFTLLLSRECQFTFVIFLTLFPLCQAFLYYFLYHFQNYG